MLETVNNSVFTLTDNLVSNAPTKIPGEATAGYLSRKYNRNPKYICDDKLPNSHELFEDFGTCWAKSTDSINKEDIKELKQNYDQLITKDNYSVYHGGLENKVKEPYMKYIGSPRSEKNKNLSGDLFKKLPEINTILDQITPLIKQYYQSEVRLFDANIRRTKHLPKEHVHQSGGYSNLWHLDGHPHDTIKVFIPLSEIDENCGPFHWLSFEDTKRVRTGGFDRKTEGIPRSNDTYDNAKKFIGEPGDLLICNSNVLLHRAGVPKKDRKRDMMVLLFGPSRKPLNQSWQEQAKCPTPQGREKCLIDTVNRLLQ